MAFELKKIWQLIQGTSLRDEYEIPVSEGQGTGDTKKYNISQLKAHIWSFVQQQISLVTQGPQGPTGTAGQQGQPGTAGAKGDKGDRGEAGLKGDTGPQGPVGIQGPKGDKGDNGNAGEQGIQGVPGEQGIQGLQGERGIQGIKGDFGGVNMEKIEITEYNPLGLTIDFTENNRQELFGFYPTVEIWEKDGDGVEYFNGVYSYKKDYMDEKITSITVGGVSPGQYMLLKSGPDVVGKTSGNDVNGYYEIVPMSNSQDIITFDMTINNRLERFGLYPHIESFSFQPGEQSEASEWTGYSRELAEDGTLKSINILGRLRNGYTVIKSSPALVVPPSSTNEGHYEMIPFSFSLDTSLIIDFTINDRQKLFGRFPDIEMWVIIGGGDYSLSSTNIHKTVVNGLITKLTVDMAFREGYVLLKSGSGPLVLPPVNIEGDYEVFHYEENTDPIEIDFKENNRQNRFGLYPYIECWEHNDGSFARMLSIPEKTIVDGKIDKVFVWHSSSAGHILIKSTPALSPIVPTEATENMEVIPFIYNTDGVPVKIDFNQNNRRELFGLYPDVQVVYIDEKNIYHQFPDGEFHSVNSFGYNKCIKDGVINYLAVYVGDYRMNGVIVLKASRSQGTSGPVVESSIDIPVNSNYTIGSIGSNTFITVPDNNDAIVRTLTFPDPSLNAGKSMTFFLKAEPGGGTNLWSIRTASAGNIVDANMNVFANGFRSASSPDGLEDLNNKFFVFQSNGHHWIATNNRYVPV
ncbi:MAG: hypothetical protein P0Y49_15390 [Candidatus Pedobacter colombiensis]|uniref:Collagen-like protein n=1 Tax=Candidatus Pedobacter colombiensis TaxID=3121371 RepID=A0AAJ5W510_9SPHI|nr:hypothetical protein [Pedobacter sp.]WEK18174.1 MAG: hypothetical protein P0Y49_15390 [Pedobacter sp.]